MSISQVYNLYLFSPPLLKSIQIIFGFHIEIVRAATPGSRFDEEAMPLTRSWCLFELLQTVLLQVPWGAPVVRKILRKILLGNGEVCNKGTKLLASPCLRTDDKRHLAWLWCHDLTFPHGCL